MELRTAQISFFSKTVSRCFYAYCAVLLAFFAASVLVGGIPNIPSIIGNGCASIPFASGHIAFLG